MSDLSLRERGACAGLMSSRKPILFLRRCDFTQKMASSGSKNWRAFDGESTTWETPSKIGWKHEMAASGNWKQNVARSRKIVKRAIK